MPGAAGPALRPPPMPLDDAIARLLAAAVPLEGIEELSILDADGRVLAQDVVAQLTVPPQDNSAMDGYAVRAADCIADGATGEAVLPVSQRIPAGVVGEALAPGTAARIFTGAQIPEGADTVVMQEDAQALPDAGPGAGGLGRVRLRGKVPAGRHIRRAGEDVRHGDTVLARGERLTPQSLGLVASIGFDRVKVVRRPRVALLSTGDELVMPGEVPPQAMPPGAIYNSNRFFLHPLLRRMQCEVQDLGLVPDDRDATAEVLRAASARNDLIISTGGVSVGEEDHVRAALQTLGELQFWSIAMKPGKPFVYGWVPRGASADAASGAGSCHVCGLPGNPVSSFMTFLLLVRPFLLALQGARVTAPSALAMRADFDWPSADKRREFLRVRPGVSGGLELFPNQGSGVLTSTVWGEGIVDNPPGRAIVRGDTVRFIPFAQWLA